MEEKQIAVADEKNIEKAVKEFTPNPAFVSAGAMLPKSYKDVMELSTIMAKSNLVPTGMTGRPEACALAIMFGLEIGLAPTQALQNIMVVNGRPALWGDAVKALVMGSRDLILFDEDPAHKALAQGYGRCRLKRKGGMEVEVQFSIEDAKRAKLWTKQGPWQDYPGRMLQMRARSWACRDLFPDVLKGMQIREELDDYEIITPSAVTQPRAKAPENVQEASIIQNPVEEVKAQPAQPQAAEQAPQTDQPIGDAQEPALDPDVLIDDERRKDLFAKRSKAKVSLDAARAWLAAHNVKDTSELTNKMADEFEDWIHKTSPINAAK